MKARACELCSGVAALYCSSDSAFLCWNCDAKVHGANFLVARHARRTVCSECKGFTGVRFSGVGYQPLPAICRSCQSGSPGDDLDSSSSSSRISSTESCATTKKIDFDRLKSGSTVVSSSSGTDAPTKNSEFLAVLSGEVTSEARRKGEVETKTTRSRVPSNFDSKAEAILVNWCTKLGQTSGSAVLRLASHAFGVSLEKLAVLPFRVGLAASLWFSFRFCKERSVTTWQILKNLEEISGVPAKLILAAESKLARVLKMRKPRRHQQEEEEGWAECST